MSDNTHNHLAFHAPVKTEAKDALATATKRWLDHFKAKQNNPEYNFTAAHLLMLLAWWLQVNAINTHQVKTEVVV